MSLPRIGVEGSLADRAYEALKEAIVNRTLHPGALLNEERLAEELGISRTPLRTALQRLHHEHLLASAPGKGFMVASLNRRDMGHVFLMRRLLEPAAARLAAGRRTERDVSLLRDAVVAQQEAVEAGDYLRFLRHDEEFHLTIASVSENPYLQSAIRTMQVHGHRFLVLDKHIHGRAPDSIREHAALISAIERRDGDGAEDLMRQHVQRTESKLAEVLPWPSA